MKSYAVHPVQLTKTRDSGKAKLFLYWLIVGIPLGWGVWQVITKSLVLFTGAG